MDFLEDLIGFWHLLLPLLAVLLPAGIYSLSLSKKKSLPLLACNTQMDMVEDVKKARPGSAHFKPTEWYRKMFFQLQNLEDHPEALEPAREELLVMFSQGLSIALRQPTCSSNSGILSIESYSSESLCKFLKGTYDKTQSEWARYLERRKQGQGPELFATAEAAKAWLIQQAPVKFVDGAWLGHIHKITTPFALRGVTRQVWQVLSEELGDGDPSKHHVNLYRNILDDIGCSLPNSHSAEFIHLSEWDRVENRGTWEAAVGQLVISLFPNEFLPEILGFNLHFETVTLETMQVAHELKGLGIDPYYFLIHITIDNADSGHTAMASHAVMNYMKMMREAEGETAAKQAWKRVQVGYILSQTLGECSSPKTVGLGLSNPDVLLGPHTTRVMDILRSKALVSHSVHSQSKVRIGQYALSDWLDESMWEHSNGLQQLEFLTALSKAKPWVFAGESSKSLLLRELSWRGRMFGAFTNNEVATLRLWIDALRPKSERLLYWTFTHRQPVTSREAVADLRDPARHHPCMLPVSEDEMPQKARLCTTVIYREPGIVCREPWMQQSTLSIASIARLTDIITLWFAHIGLLENTINIPSRAASRLHSRILRVLRAQAGFCIESDIVAGMDESRRDSCTSLVDIGLELTQKFGQTTISAEFSSLQDVFLLAAKHGQGEESARLANEMLRWATRPAANLGLLLGLALAFLDFKRAVRRAPGLLGWKTRLLLEAIVEREKTNLVECARELQSTDDSRYKDLLRGYHLAMTTLPNCM